jgi:alpha-L-arabinofuranosidase
VVEVLREEATPSLASSAGVDTARRELVLKLVNGAERERTVQLRGLPLSRQWKGEILTAGSLAAENTLDNPNLVAPRPWTVRAWSAVTLPPRSLVIVRIPLTPAELRPYVGG